MSIWISSDCHFGHNQRFLYEPRGFGSIEEHDAAIIKNWNEVVKPNDTVYLLGDCILNDNNHGIECMKKLNGQIFIIGGNHDTVNRVKLYKQDFDFIGYGMPIKYKKYSFFLSHYPSLCSNFDFDKPLRERVINICGHCHTKDKFKDMDKGLCYHVELDAHNNYPVLIDNIINDIKEYLNLC